MTESEIVVSILYKVRAVRADEARIGATGEQIAVALVLNKPELFPHDGDTILQAVDRLGPDWDRRRSKGAASLGRYLINSSASESTADRDHSGDASTTSYASLRAAAAANSRRSRGADRRGGRSRGSSRPGSTDAGNTRRHCRSRAPEPAVPSRQVRRQWPAPG